MGQTGWSEVHGNELSFDPTVVNPATGTLGAAWYGFSHANGRHSVQKPNYNTWMPRVGASYSLDSKTVIRGGFGVYTFSWNTDTYGSNVLGAAFGSSGSQNDSTNGVNPVVLLRSDGNTNYQGAKGASINSLYLAAPTGADSWNGQPIPFQEYHAGIPTIQQWNVSVQRQLTQSIVSQVAYIASHGYNLAYLTDLNAIPENRLGPNDSVYRPYPQFQNLGGVLSNARSNYNSLQLSFDKRMSSGLEFSGNYVWSKFLDNQDSSGWGTKQGNQPYQNAYSPSANYGPSNFDVRNALKGQMIYQLPFGAGRHFMNDSNRLMNAAFGGWQTSMTMVVQDGQPFTPYMSTNNTYSLAAASVQFPNQIGNPKLGAHGVHEWFNAAAYQDPGPGVFGNMQRNSVYGPGLVTFNGNLAKTFDLTERLKASLSASFANLFNHPAFAQPDLLIGPGHNGTINAVTIGGRSGQLVGKIFF